MNDIMDPVYMVAMMGEIDATKIERLRALAREKSKSGHTVSYTAIVIKTVAMLMKENPDANRAVLPAARESAYARCLARLNANPPWLYLFHPVDVFAAKPACRGLTLDPKGVLGIPA